MDDESPASVVAIEAFAEALRGHTDIALRLVDAAIAALGPSSPAHAVLQLTRARLDGESSDAMHSLAELAASDAARGAWWRVHLEIARISHAAGRRTEAASALNQSLLGFRAAAPALGVLAEPLGTLISAGVARLKEPVAPRPTRDGDDDSNSRETHALVRLLDLGKQLLSEPDPEEVLRLVLHEAIELCAAERGFVVVQAGGTLEVAVAENLDRSTVAEATLQVSRSLLDEVLRTGKPVVLEPAVTPDATQRWSTLTDLAVSFAACVPIVGGDGVLGALYLDRRAVHDRRIPETRFLSRFAALAGAALENASAHRRQSHELEAARAILKRRDASTTPPTRYGALVGVSPPMQEIYQRLESVATSDLPVLIIGETGTGKEVVARVCHERSGRRDGEFIALNCAGMTDSLLQSELFGAEKGAFTGADRARPGLFELAHRGTIFLDEVGDMSPQMQAHLLRVLESGEVRRVGGRVTSRVDARVLAATNREIDEQVRSGEFRRDLFFRLNVVRVSLPPLRERVEDIPLLVAELLAKATAGGALPRLEDAVLRRLQRYGWPGNVRELENVIRRLAVLGVDPIEERHLPRDILDLDEKPARPGTLRAAELGAIRAAIEAAAGNKTHAARILGVDRKTLRLWLRQHGLE